ncbi:MAG: class I SAM-dependent methyltransferase [Chlamydiota bacterium]
MESLSENNGIAALYPLDEKVYSVGISTGGVAEMRMAAALPSRRIIATTIDAQGAEFARKKILESGLSERIEVRIEDVGAPLPYEEGAFDFIYARLVLHYLPKESLDRSLKELFRVLKTGGRLYVVVRSVECQEAQVAGALYDPETGITRYVFNGQQLSRYFHSAESIQRHLQAAGFQILHVKSYEELLCSDFERLKPASQPDSLIEVLAQKLS